MEGFNALWTILVIIGTIVSLGGSVLYANWSEFEQCKLMDYSDFQTKIMYNKLVIANCFVYDDSIGKFIPYEKFRALAD